MLRLALAWHLAAQVPEPPERPIADVRWSAPPGCPGRADLLAAVARRQGRELGPDELALDARVARLGARYALRLHLVVGERSEQRELTADTCAPLLDATALLIVHTLAELALAPPPPVVDAPVAAVAPPEAPAASPAPPIAAPIARPATPAPAPAVPRRPGPGVLLRTHGGLELGAAPRVTGLAGLAVGLLWPRVRLEARASFLGPRSTTREATQITALLLAGSLHACARPGRGALEVPLCAGLEAGGMRGAASGPTANRAAYMPWLGLVVGAGVAWRVRPRFALWSALEVVGGLVRPRFVLAAPEPDVALFRPWPVSGRLVLGLELRLGDPR